MKKMYELKDGKVLFEGSDLGGMADIVEHMNKQAEVLDFMLKERDKANKKDGLVGSFVHILKDGAIHNQGHITGVSGDQCVIQRFEWLLGTPSDVICVPRSDIADPEKCRIYSSSEAMNHAWMKDIRRREASGELPRCGDEWDE